MCSSACSRIPATGEAARLLRNGGVPPAARKRWQVFRSQLLQLTDEKLLTQIDLF